jgi:uncharacterized protein
MHPISLSEPLSYADLQGLLGFLKKYDLPDLLEIHGFLAAIVSGPNLIMPSDWMGFLGLNNAEFESMEEAQKIMGTVMQIYNNIAHQFQDQTFQVFNSTGKDKNNKGTSSEKTRWAKGYITGVAFDEEAWIISDIVPILLRPISSLVMDDEHLQQLISQNTTELTPEQMRQYGEDKLNKAANAIYQYWLKRRNPVADVHHMQQPTVKVGRNDPCLCGSGKKFKKCCLH